MIRYPLVLAIVFSGFSALACRDSMTLSRVHCASMDGATELAGEFSEWGSQYTLRIIQNGKSWDARPTERSKDSENGIQGSFRLWQRIAMYIEPGNVDISIGFTEQNTLSSDSGKWEEKGSGFPWRSKTWETFRVTAQFDPLQPLKYTGPRSVVFTCKMFSEIWSDEGDVF